MLLKQNEVKTSSQQIVTCYKNWISQDNVKQIQLVLGRYIVTNSGQAETDGLEGFAVWLMGLKGYDLLWAAPMLLDAYLFHICV